MSLRLCINIVYIYLIWHVIHMTTKSLKLRSGCTMLAGISCTSLLKRKARRFCCSEQYSVRARFVHDDDPLGLEAGSDMPDVADVARLSFDSSDIFSSFTSPNSSGISTR